MSNYLNESFEEKKKEKKRQTEITIRITSMWLLRVDCLNESFKKTQKHSSLNQQQVTLPGHYFELTIQKPHQLKSYHLNQEKAHLLSRFFE